MKLMTEAEANAKLNQLCRENQATGIEHCGCFATEHYFPKEKPGKQIGYTFTFCNLHKRG